MGSRFKVGLLWALSGLNFESSSSSGAQTFLARFTSSSVAVTLVVRDKSSKDIATSKDPLQRERGSLC